MTVTIASDAANAVARDLLLRHVLIFHRHGDRTPVLTEIGEKIRMDEQERAFWAARIATEKQLMRLAAVGKVVGANPMLPANAAPLRGSAYPCGMLTQKGVEHMTKKGKQLRERYGHLVDIEVLTGSDMKDREHVYVLSSSVPRTIQSVQCLLHGMFHDDEEDEVDDALAKTAKIKPVFHVRTYERNVLAPQHRLQVFNEIEQIVADDVALLRDPEQRAAMEQLGLHIRETWGVPAGNPVPWTAVRDALTCRDAHEMPFPEGITREMFQRINEYDAWLWHRLYSRRDFCHKAFHHGVREVYTFLKNVVEPTDETKEIPKLAFFSAHDNSIVALLSALQVQIDGALPEYGTIVAFEIYQDPTTKEHFIKVLFDNREVPFMGHEHDMLCPFAHFELLALDFLAFDAQIKGENKPKAE